ncbi:hypothetical protein J14TS2_43350 [Bacillus sp. J14TS2]|nr:hypothetical protein J14TS2_43350 [Bacillus sp. J14TS2]
MSDFITTFYSYFVHIAGDFKPTDKRNSVSSSITMGKIQQPWYPIEYDKWSDNNVYVYNRRNIFVFKKTQGAASCRENDAYAKHAYSRAMA